MADRHTQSYAREQLARALNVASAFPWQLALLERFIDGELPSALDVPTGLGKTAVMAIWLVARAAGAAVPRRLIYVVDRRAVVDQATDVAMGLRELVGRDRELATALDLEPGQALPISTLRGQFVDNREWLTDPSLPAIVLGTVDMIGSRLLFEGYGVSRRMRPYHAGLVGADSLIVLDEAHLVPPFERLVRSVSGFAANPTSAGVIPPLRVLSLSATGRAQSASLTLSSDDRAHPVVARRLAAVKRLVVRPAVAAEDLPKRLAEEAWALRESAMKPCRCIVFCNRRKDAQAVADLLRKLAGKTSVAVQLFVGGRRVFERENAAEWLRANGFIAGTRVDLVQPTFVIATSAGEVGVDLDADHMVCDLVAWERMVQRLGRVNRRGDGSARVIVVPATSDDDDEAIAKQLEAVTALLAQLPQASSDGFDASPGALTALRERANTDDLVRQLVERGSTPEPLYPALTGPVVEAWSMTSLEEHSGRPEVEPWIRGWIDNDDPQTTIVWRRILPVTRDRQLLPPEDLTAFLEAAGPHVVEQLETETWSAMAWLSSRVASLSAQSNDTPIGVILHSSRPPRAIAIRDFSSKDGRSDIEFRLRGATLLVDTCVGGLADGLLDADATDASDVTEIERAAGQPVIALHVRFSTADDRHAPASDEPSPWRTELRLAVDHTGDGDEREWLVVETLATTSAESEEGRSVAPMREQQLDEHEAWTERAARRIAGRLALSPHDTELLALAARLHDEGKKAKRWQQAFRAPADGIYAKTKSRPNLQLLGGYRHELGSLPYAERDARVQALDDDARDLCLHLIAAHHGHARPVLRTDGAEEPPSKLEARAQAIALRFARLGRRLGPWGLAWWETLLRAADQQASRENDEVGSDE